MNRFARIATGWMCVSIIAISASHANAFDASPLPITAQGSLQVAFAPWDNVEELITKAINAAKKQILIQAYLLTDKEIAFTLIKAQQRGIDVRILADAEQSAKMESSKIPELAAAGIAVWLETKYQNAHNKIILIDAGTEEPIVITGSFNFTWSAQHKNAENILIMRKNPALAIRYVLNWERHRQDATPYTK
jgi:phosphatidylserine/phosphatidylglycerophosphate/cardiolipin synthase-like enzyme